MYRRNDGSGVIAAIIVIGMFLFIGWIMDASEPKCIKTGCDSKPIDGSAYCYLHKTYSSRSSYKSKTSTYSSGSGSSSSTSSGKTSGTSSAKKKNNYSSNSYNSYDEGYEDVYEEDDYDWERYWEDDDYADGVDDAIDELDW